LIINAEREDFMKKENKQPKAPYHKPVLTKQKKLKDITAIKSDA